MVSAWQLSIVMHKVAKMPTDSIQENIEIEVQSFEKQKERLCVRWELMKIINYFTFQLIFVIIYGFIALFDIIHRYYFN